MNTSKKVIISLPELNQKLTTEAKRIVKEKEEGITKYMSKTANLLGDSTIVFKKKDGTVIRKSFRLNENNDLRLAFDKFLTDKK